MAVIDIAKFNRLFWLIRVGCATTPLALRGSRAVVPRVAEYGNPGLRTNPLRGNEYASFDGGRVVETSGVALSEDEEAWLTQLGVNLIVPMSGADGRMAGLLLLGEKKSEEPYTPNDRQLLQTITAQMAVVYENVWLKEHAAKEQKIKHEVLARFEDQQINLVKECPACGACYDSTSDACEKDQRELTLSLPVERTIDKKYRLEQMIGRGGMGAVYEATDLRLNRRIAIKIMLGSMFGDRTALRRFEREAQASARLNHPNIITGYDYGGIRTDGAYLVMELVRGSTLRSELQHAGRLDPQTTAAWFTQLLEGVNAAHESWEPSPICRPSK